MTVDKNGRGEYIFWCNFCTTSLYTMSKDEDEAHGVLASEGWKTIRLGFDVRHACPLCKNMKL